MEALKEFLFDHYGHALVFSDNDAFDEYEEINADNYKEPTEDEKEIIRNY
jgi:hypothetical protein